MRRCYKINPATRLVPPDDAVHFMVKRPHDGLNIPRESLMAGV